MASISKELMKVLKKIEDATDLDARFYRKSTLKRRLNFRMKATNSKTYKDYLNYLKHNSLEYDKFLDTLTINVTDFLRDKQVFFTLERKILPDILKKIKEKSRKRIRIWSIGCSKGQEPYSLAIIFNEILNGSLKDFQIIIQATDLNKAVLRKAKQGLYSKDEIKNVSKKYLIKYFQKEGNGFKIKENVRKLVRFRQHDLIKGKNLGRFHLILCRNLFIFFEPQLQEKMFKKIHSSLKNNGVLVLGQAETPKNGNFFHDLYSRDHIYGKNDRGKTSTQMKQRQI